MSAFLKQTAPDPTPDATVYQEVAEVLLRIDEWKPLTDELKPFTDLQTLEQQEQVCIEGTRDVETAIFSFIGGSKTPGGSFLLYPRVESFAFDGSTLIDGLPLESYTDALILYYAELARTILEGDPLREPALLEGVVEEEIDAEGAEIRRRYVAEGAPHDFFRNRPHMWRLLSQSFQGQRCR